MRSEANYGKGIITKMRIIIGADCVARGRDIPAFQSGEPLRLIGNELKEIWDQADLRVVNLEVPLSDTDSPIQKNGPCLRSPENTIAGFTGLKIDAVTLANNHIKDHGERGIDSTIRALRQSGIEYFGLGENLNTSKRPYIVKTSSGSTIAFYACVEHEFSCAGIDTVGANPFDPYSTFDDISDIRNRNDYCVVLYHGGKEKYPYPSPDLQIRCRRMIDKGADVVICQHSHCIGCVEIYNNGFIIYGQGDFIFDHQRSGFDVDSLLVQLDTNGDGLRIEYIPVTRGNEGVRLATGEKAESILSGFNRRSEEIREPGFIDRKYAEFAEANLCNYYKTFSGVGSSKIYRALNKLSHGKLDERLIQNIRTKNRIFRMRNYIECEAHRELLLKGFSQIQ